MTDGYVSFSFSGNAAQRPARISRRALMGLMETDGLLSSADSQVFIECNQELLDELGRFIEQVRGEESGQIVTVSGADVRAFFQTHPRRRPS